MKRFFLFALSIMLLSNVSNAQSIEWITIEQAEQNAKKDGKNAKRVFVDCYTDWCGWCKKMDKDTFEDTLIAKIMNKYFYTVKFNAEQRENLTIQGKLYKNPNPSTRRSSHEYAYAILGNRLSYPSFSILTPEFKVVTVIPGYYTPKDFEPMIVFMGGKYDEKYSWEEFQKIYQEKIREDLMKELYNTKQNKKK